MHEPPSLEIPRRPRASVSPWVEISAWILAFAVLLAAQCSPERLSPNVARGQAQAVESTR